jgi:carbon monoxide dehydrogenase subunit G
MRVDERFEVECARDRVYQELNDVGGIGSCVAGVREIQLVNDDESRWRIEQSLGFMSRTFKLDARIVDRRPPERIAFAATGMDVQINGHVELQAVTPTVTGCDVVIEIDVAGPLAPVVDMLARGPQQQLIAETLGNMRARLEAVARGEQPAAPGADVAQRPATAEAERRPGWWQQLLRRLRGGRTTRKGG